MRCNYNNIEPVNSNTRVRTFFAILPRFIGGECRWLEKNRQNFS